MKNLNTERGQSLVELSISLVILLFLLSGAVEFGMAYFQFVQLRDAAQEGALYGSINPTDNAGIMARIRDSSQSPIDLSDNTVVPDSNITITPSNTTSPHPCEGDGLFVEVKYDHKVFMPFMKQITGSIIPLKASVTDTILSPVCSP
jgi:Flp pilus assembly protein TadG